MPVGDLLSPGALPGLRERLLRLGGERRGGTVYATTAVYHRDREPHNVALVDLEEGFRMMSRIEGVPVEEVEVGMKVALAVREEDGEPAAVFVPVAKTGEG